MLEELSSEHSMTKNRGTMLYRSPEQFGRESLKKEASKEVDVFSLGLVFLVIHQFEPSNKTTIPLSGKRFYINFCYIFNMT